MKPETTILDKYGPAMEITDQAAADSYFEECIAHSMMFGRTRERAEVIERTNLGYFAGYYGSGTRGRVERLFRCEHPVFGKIAERGQPTAKEALDAGHDEWMHAVTDDDSCRPNTFAIPKDGTETTVKRKK